MQIIELGMVACGDHEKRALGELAIVSLGVLLALWADQAMQARQEVARATGRSMPGFTIRTLRPIPPHW